MKTMHYKDEVFKDKERGIDLSTGEDIEELIVEDCTFENCVRGINGWHKGPHIKRAVIRNCFFTGGQFGVLFRNDFDELAVRHNLFRGIGTFESRGTAIHLGSTAPDARLNADAVAVNNTIEDIRGESLAFGIYARGERFLIRDNLITNVQIAAVNPEEDEDASGIYTKLKNSQVLSNTLIDAGGYEGCISVKGEWGSNEIRNNDIFVTDPAPYEDPRWNRAICVIRSTQNVIKNNRIGSPLRIVLSPSALGNIVEGAYRVSVDPSAISFYPL